MSHSVWKLLTIGSRVIVNFEPCNKSFRGNWPSLEYRQDQIITIGQNRQIKYHKKAIKATYNFGFKWRLNLSVHELYPVNVSKKHVIFDVLFSIFSTTQAFGRVLGQELKI